MAIRPLLGLGVSYAVFLDETATGSLDAAAGGAVGLSFKNTSSAVAQIGLEFRLADDWRGMLSGVVLDSDTDARFTGPAGTTVSRLDIDAWVLSLSVGYRFRSRFSWPGAAVLLLELGPD